MLDAADVVDLARRRARRGARRPRATDDGHDHGDLDPHFWLDPLLMADLGDAVAEQLAERRPRPTPTAYAARRRGPARRPRGPRHASTPTGLADCERTRRRRQPRRVRLPRPALRPGACADHRPLPRRRADAGRPGPPPGAGRRTRAITTVFTSRSPARTWPRRLADDLGLETAVLDPIEGLTDETADEDYLSLMRAEPRRPARRPTAAVTTAVDAGPGARRRGRASAADRSCAASTSTVAAG